MSAATAQHEHRTSARERLLAAANELFYAEGVQTVGIDRIIERAGVAKGSLYNVFRSKEELVAAYLASRHDGTTGRLTNAIEGFDDPRRKILAVFDAQAQLFKEPDFNGCAFIAASTEARPGGLVQSAADRFRAWIRAMFTDLAEQAGAPDPASLGRQLQLLYDGAGLAARMDHCDPGIEPSARDAAQALLDAALTRSHQAGSRVRADRSEVVASPPQSQQGRRQLMPDGGVARLRLPVGERDHVQGPAGAPVTLVEYGDYECPYCRAAVPIVRELQGVLGDQLRYVFRHFPLADLHPHAQHAAEAAEAAAAQGQFFEMHAALFEHQEALDDEQLVQYAVDLDLDAVRIRNELAAHAHAGRVREDFESGQSSDARGTPTFYLDDVRYDGIVGVRQILAAIQEAHPDVVSASPEGQVGQRTIPRVVRQRSQFGGKS